jgi:beta-galactosidase
VGALQAETAAAPAGAGAEAGAGAGATFRLRGAVQSGRLVAESVHATGASVVAAFDSGLQAGAPALTRHRFGAGEAWYVATQPVSSAPSAAAAGSDALDAVVAAVVEASGVRPVVEGLPAGVEAARRGDLVTLINHGDARIEIAIACTDAETGRAVESVALDAQGVAFLIAPAVPPALATPVVEPSARESVPSF